MFKKNSAVVIGQPTRLKINSSQFGALRCSRYIGALYFNSTANYARCWWHDMPVGWRDHYPDAFITVYRHNLLNFAHFNLILDKLLNYEEF